jgi:hypothetical protein
MTSEPGFTITLGIDREFRNYSVTEDELSRLASGTANLWKDFCLVAVSIAAGTAVTAYSLPSSSDIVRQKEILWLVAGMALFMTVFFALGWKKSHKSIATLVDSIRRKERITLNPGSQFLPPAPTLR